MIWHDVTSLVMKYAKAYFKSVAAPHTKKPKHGLQVRKNQNYLSSVLSPQDQQNPISSFVCLSKTSFDLIFISSKDTTTYLSMSKYSLVVSCNLWIFAGLKPGWGLKNSCSPLKFFHLVKPRRVVHGMLLVILQVTTRKIG